MKLFKKNNSQFWWYDFTVRGQPYRGSTGEINKTRASKIAGLKLAAAVQGSDPLDRKAPTLREYSKQFLHWVDNGRLEPETKRYYRNGWRLVKETPIAGMRMDRIKTDAVEALSFSGSPSNGNNALRVLRRMLNKAREANLITTVPRFKLFKEVGRDLRIDDEAERRLLAVAEQPLSDIIVVIRDTGMRNGRELYRMRVENVHWRDGRSLFLTAKQQRAGASFRSATRSLRSCSAAAPGDPKDMSFRVGTRLHTSARRSSIISGCGRGVPRAWRRTGFVLRQARLRLVHSQRDREPEGSDGLDGAQRCGDRNEVSAPGT